jgi:hypothetical protein
MRASMIRRLAFPLAALVLVVLACAKPGDDCTDTPGSCKDKASHLVCVNKKYILETCKGQNGCNDEGKTLICDSSKADVGDGCGIEGSRACSSDGKQELRCRGNKFAIEWGCRGGCTIDQNGNPKCAPMGEVGQPCRSDSYACDAAQKTELSCGDDGKYAVHRTCHGDRGCETAPGGGIRCDRTKGVEGEACLEEGRGACDAAQQYVLVCQGGKFTKTMDCLGALHCELPGNYSVRCDKSIVPLGEACTEDGAISCTPDGKQVTCTGGKWDIDKKWKPKKGETCANRYRVSFETEKFDAR